MPLDQYDIDQHQYDIGKKKCTINYNIGLQYEPLKQ